MSYVDAIYLKDDDLIKVVERSSSGTRLFKEYPAKYIFYYPDSRGKYLSIFGEPLSRATCKSNKEFQKELRIHSSKKLYESDIRPVSRCLSEHYLGADAPKLNVAFFDIEVDFDPERGYASPDDAFMPITAIAVYLQWLDTLICLAVPPKTLTMEQAEDLVKDFPNTYLFKKESELLDNFLNIIEDADILSGWNSDSYDIPYTVNRIVKALGKESTRRLCLWNELPKKKEYERYGKLASTYTLSGRVHLDSLELYRKYTYEERHSYSLDSIGEHELNERKIAYEGSLDQLYNHDFKKFIEYNRQDTMLLDKLDKKLKFIDLANTLAHENTVTIPATMGAVAVTEQAIINEVHNRGMIVPDRRKNKDEDYPAAGAYVAYPKKGLHDWIGSVDINSLYPSAIRALNMSPETIIGQVRLDKTMPHIEKIMREQKKTFTAAWENMFGTLEYEAIMKKDNAFDVTIDWNEGGSDTLGAAEVHTLIFESKQPWILSANGTIFTYEKEGIVPGLLSRWYRERKEMQAELKKAIGSGDKTQEEYWDKRQLVKKINLNSLYGALLNKGCRFEDPRIGQSTTLCGRTIVKHMNSKINQIITGEYNHVGDSCIYSDTDSCYFSAYGTLKSEIDNGNVQWDKDFVITLYDNIANNVNESFPEMMASQFNCPTKKGEIIKAGREIVASKGLFITKKRYAVLYYDKEGKRKDSDTKPGEIKAMGLDLKRSDTPAFVQDFLSKVLEMVLNNREQSDVIDFIKEFRIEFSNKLSWQKGTPKRVNNVTKYTEKEEKAGKANLPGHVRASLNWNKLKKIFDDRYSMNITDGSKIIVCKLKNNPMGFTSVAYPIDEPRLPKWFKELPFDDDAMEQALIDEKLSNLISVLEWDLSLTKTNSTFSQFFTFS